MNLIPNRRCLARRLSTDLLALLARRHSLGCCILVLSLGGFFLQSQPAYAGWLLSPAVKWVTSSAEPEGSEATPNYYGYGGALNLGYSIKQVFDIAAVGQYAPMRLRKAEVGVGDAVSAFYGAEFALRFYDSVYFALRGGQSSFHLTKPRSADELTGTWRGPAGGLSLGAIHALSKQSFLQTSFDFMHTVAQDPDQSGAGRRRFDSFSISLAYVFNSMNNYAIENSIFKYFVDSIMFF